MPIDPHLVLNPSDPRLYTCYAELCRQAGIEPPPTEWVYEQVNNWNAMLAADAAQAEVRAKRGFRDRLGRAFKEHQ
jgi:DNA topoisomerase IB